MKPKESPAKKIQRLERELEDERVKNLSFNELIDIIDSEHGTNLIKKYLAYYPLLLTIEHLPSYFSAKTT